MLKVVNIPSQASLPGCVTVVIPSQASLPGCVIPVIPSQVSLPGCVLTVIPSQASLPAYTSLPTTVSLLDTPFVRLQSSHS